MTMGEASKDLLRERIKNKRALEGLDDIPQEELFGKKRKYDLSYEEQEKIYERRTRNKEAAEKSRKKKKQEFEKLQSENDQLNQDKCELAAMIETLKKQNVGIRVQLEHLKRWIAKRADQLGLHKKENTLPSESSLKSDVLRGDPSLHSTKIDITEDCLSDVERSHSPSAYSPSPSETTSKAGSPPPTSTFQAVGTKTVAKTVPQQHHDVEAPWLIGQPNTSSSTTKVSVPAQAEKKKDQNKTVTAVTSSFQPISAPQQIMDQVQSRPIQVISDEPQLVYMPSPVIVVQGEGGQQVLMQAPQAAPMQFVYGPTPVSGFPQIAMPAQSQIFMAAEAPKPLEMEFIPSANRINESTMPVINGRNAADSMTTTADTTDKAEKMIVAEDKDTAQTEIGEKKFTTTERDPSVVTAIESLLKLGYKVERPGDEKNAVPSADAALENSELEEGRLVIVHLDEPESFPTNSVAQHLTVES